MSDEIREFKIEIAQAELDDLKARLSNPRFPEKEPVDDWEQGIPLDYVRDLAAYWRDEYDWRRGEAALNAMPQFVTETDGLNIHFIHIRSPEAGARPLLMTHGWPGSLVEFMNVIGPLTDPVTHGGKAEDAFHLVMPALPGFGFSGKPDRTGWSVEKIAEAWDVLMLRLGYDRYFAQGGDWGGVITGIMGGQNKGHCAGIHLNLVVVGPPSADWLAEATPQEQNSMKRFETYSTKGGGYAAIQGTKPQTLGYALADSPVGQMAWIVEKFQGWSDGSPDERFSRDHLLDNVMMYWLTNSGTSSGRIYWESFGNTNLDEVSVPTGCTIFPEEIITPSRRWAEQRFKNIQYWNEAEEGGHFAAMEVPELFVNEVRSSFREMEL